MKIGDIDLGELPDQIAERIALPTVTRGRVVHIDADFLAYMMSAEKADGSDLKSFDDMTHNAQVKVEEIRILAGAERVHLHLTPSSSNKGHRYELAMLKEYQANRIDKAKPRYLHIMRDYLAKTWPATLHIECEADDGMSSEQYKAISNGQTDLSVIASKDKDLHMVPGWHLDWDTGRMTKTDDDFGYVELRERGSGTKVLDGYGQKFFWAQMLTGDTADNISGLPKLVGHYLDIYKPLAKPVKKRPAGAIGPVLAVQVLDGVTTNRDAFMLVKDMYKRYGEELGFSHWKDGNIVEWNRAFLSEAQLLWMRRQPHDVWDVAKWLKEISS